MGEGIFNKFKNWITEEEEDFDGVEEEYEQEDEEESRINLHQYQILKRLKLLTAYSKPNESCYSRT